MDFTSFPTRLHDPRLNDRHPEAPRRDDPSPGVQPLELDPPTERTAIQEAGEVSVVEVECLQLTRQPFHPKDPHDVRDSPFRHRLERKADETVRAAHDVEAVLANEFIGKQQCCIRRGEDGFPAHLPDHEPFPRKQGRRQGLKRRAFGEVGGNQRFTDRGSVGVKLMESHPAPKPHAGLGGDVRGECLVDLLQQDGGHRIHGLVALAGGLGLYLDRGQIHTGRGHGDRDANRLTGRKGNRVRQHGRPADSIDPNSIGTSERCLQDEPSDLVGQPPGHLADGAEKAYDRARHPGSGFLDHPQMQRLGRRWVHSHEQEKSCETGYLEDWAPHSSPREEGMPQDGPPSSAPQANRQGRKGKSPTAEYSRASSSGCCPAWRAASGARQ